MAHASRYAAAAGVRRVLIAAIAVSACAGAPRAASAHGVPDSAQAHADADFTQHTAADEAALERRTRQATAANSQQAAAVVGNEGEVGKWGPVVAWPVNAIHAALLPNGKVLAYDSVGDKGGESYPVHNFTRATVWDPATNTQTPAWVELGYNIFCSGLAHLVDGTVFVAGGNLNAQFYGIPQTHLFNPVATTWSLGPTMAVARWYPSVTPLRDGEMLITGGGPDLHEVYTTTGGLRALSTARLGLPLYPWMDVAPDGRAFYSGPDQTLRTLDPTGTGSWQTFGQRDTLDRNYGSHALYDIGKILVAGGGGSSKDARVIDINGATPTVSPTAWMANGRRQHNLTVLADGSVIATGGNWNGAGLVDLNAGVYDAELWNPATGQWKTLAAMQVTRQYHSIALLMPDGRLLSAGGGSCGICDQVGYLAKNSEVFTPPYLFKKDASGELAPRPVIASAPTVIQYGAPLQISTAQAAGIRKVALVRLGAVTHSVNMEQRYVPLTFTAGSQMLTATGPANPHIAPPGPYMLFIIDAAGVPSVASMVTVAGGNALPSVSLTQPANGATYAAPATINIAASASDADGTVSKVEFFSGATKLAEDTTAPYSYTWTGVGTGTYSLTARATDNAGGATTSAARTVSVTGPNAPPSTSITYPSDGSSFSFKSRITIAATANDSDGTIGKVEFFDADGAVKLGEDTSNPYSLRWNNPATGSHTLRVRATDSGGATTTSASIRVTINSK